MNIAIIGNGKIGSTIANFLKKDFNIFIADNIESTNSYKIDVTNKEEFKKWLINYKINAIVCATPYFLIKHVSQVAKELYLSYFDLTEDREENNFVKSLNMDLAVTQCGLAPGVVSIKAMDLIRQFDTVDSVNIRVGALPLYVNNEMQYQPSWSTYGLLNEYCNLCDSIYNNRRLDVLPLEGYEKLTIDGATYEAFNTSGGLGTLCETMEGKIRNLNYKSIRYLGHNHLMKFLLNDLNLSENLSIFEKLFNKTTLPEKDFVIIYIKVVGKINNKLLEKTYFKKIYGDEQYTAIQLTTASALCAVVDVWSKNKNLQGFLKQEDISWEEFISSQFCKLFM